VTLNPLNPQVPGPADPYEAVYQRLAALERRLESSEKKGGSGADSWHYVGGAGEPAFANSWQNNGGGYSTVAFKKVGDVVFFRGLAYRPSGASTATVFTLPVGYRPSQQCWLHMAGYNSATYISGRLDIASTGTVTPVVATIYVPFDGLFVAAV